MAKRKKQQRRPREKAATVAYTDPEGNVLTLRESLSAGTIAKLGEAPRSQAASVDDAWRRREEALFERLAVSWEIAGLPLDDQKMLLGRYRMSDNETRAWVRRAVIGLNLCPFARAVDVKDQIRYVFSDATDAETLLATLVVELQRLADTVSAWFVPGVLIAAVATFVFFAGLGSTSAPLAFVGIAFLEGHFVTPTIIGRRLSLNALAVFLGLAFWTWMWGPMGAFLSSPLLIVALILKEHLWPVDGPQLPQE